jgi:hypothetical protein
MRKKDQVFERTKQFLERTKNVPSGGEKGENVRRKCALG